MTEERSFSVVVEMADGSTTEVPVRGSDARGAFQQVKAMPGVRRVGRVIDVTGGRPDGPHGRPATRPARPAPTRRDAPQSGRPQSGRPEAAGGGGLGNTITGPRVVLNVRPSGGEQPFKHLKAPPPRPPPPVQAKPVAAAEPVVAAAKPKSKAAPRRPAAAESAPGAEEYRIHKSRRQEGTPYLLQRGTWRQQGAKRVFDAAWEEGFAERGEAEARRASLEQGATATGQG